MKQAGVPAHHVVTVPMTQPMMMINAAPNTHASFTQTFKCLCCCPWFVKTIDVDGPVITSTHRHACCATCCDSTVGRVAAGRVKDIITKKPEPHILVQLVAIVVGFIVMVMISGVDNLGKVVEFAFSVYVKSRNPPPIPAGPIFLGLVGSALALFIVFGVFILCCRKTDVYVMGTGGRDDLFTIQLPHGQAQALRRAVQQARGVSADKEVV